MPNAIALRCAQNDRLILKCFTDLVYSTAKSEVANPIDQSDLVALALEYPQGRREL
ncbi:hypothetical protein [Rhodopirellula sallentina]|uniref:hypothetical protein n=1 Tax=Rhodopirellula sallentina TaxID=1263869 RepID=UPI001360B135|nr:hypothetical protein [Rhodopirellula sallentina]